MTCITSLGMNIGEDDFLFNKLLKSSKIISKSLDEGRNDGVVSAKSKYILLIVVFPSSLLKDSFVKLRVPNVP